MIARAGELLVLDRPGREARMRSGSSRRSVLAGALATVGALAVFVASPAPTSSHAPGSFRGQELSSLPSAAQSAVSRGLGADQSAFFARRTTSGAVSLDNTAQGLRATLGAGSIVLRGGHGLRLGLTAPAVGRSEPLVPVSGLGAASVDRNRVVFSTSGSSEWFANGPLGIEQGFTLTHRPAGAGPLTISQAVSGNTRARLTTGGQGVTFSSSSGSLSYQQLVVSDATGARVPARLALTGSRLTITIQDQHALYPLRIDPTIEQTAELSASGAPMYANLGAAVAVSGSTIVVGAPGGGDGAVYVYSLPASGGWASATQTAELTASDATGNDALGTSVAISGSTIVAGAPYNNADSGSVYVYTEPAGGWQTTANYTAQLTVSDSASGDQFGSSVAISGSTIVAGSPYHTYSCGYEQGAAYVFTAPSGGGWVTTSAQTGELAVTGGCGTNTEDQLGSSVAVSASTIAVGANEDDSGGNGAVYVYTAPGGAWFGNPNNQELQNAELTASDGAAYDELGNSVGLSPSGSTIVAGAPDHTVGGNGGQGAAYVYTQPPGGWIDANENAELTTSDGAAGDNLGNSVAISGSTIIAGAPYHGTNAQGAAYLYTEPAGGWINANENAELTASDGAAGDVLGYGVGVSGSTIVAGAPYREVGSNDYEGVAYTFQTATSGGLTLSPASIVANGSSSSTATFTVDDASGNPVSGDTVTIASSGGQSIGPVVAGSTPGTYQAMITSTTTAGAATITATDTSVAPNTTATATLTQTRVAVPATTGATGAGPPSNSFTASGISHGNGGTIALRIDLPGAGTINLLGTHSDSSATTASALLQPGYRRYATDRATIKVTKAGRVKAMLRLNTAGRQMTRYARRQGWAFHVRVWITFTPTAGNPRSHEFTVRVLKAKMALKR
jgi:hypothetical protein